MGCHGAIDSNDGPVVVQNFYIVITGSYHGFDGQGHARDQLRPVISLPVIGNLGIFVKFLSYAVSYVVADYRKPVTFNIGLNGVGDVADPESFSGKLDAFKETFFSDGD